MQIIGVDFTSAPSKRKPIVAAYCELASDVLTLVEFRRWGNFQQFENALAADGPWVLGIDAPLGQARKFADSFPQLSSWIDMVRHLCDRERTEFRHLLEVYKEDRPYGDKQHRRRCDRLAGSQSPQTLYGTPVGLMFFEACPRLLAANVHLPLHHGGDRQRVVLEAYPGFAARQLVGRDSYKSDNSASQTDSRAAQRLNLMKSLTAEPGSARFGFKVDADVNSHDDPMGDSLDALICATQAAWGWRAGYADLPLGSVDPFEGWITDPGVPNPPRIT